MYSYPVYIKSYQDANQELAVLKEQENIKERKTKEREVASITIHSYTY